MIEQDIRNFNKQLDAPLPILNLPSGELSLRHSGKIVVLGMGGSHLGADLLKAYDPKLDLVVHSDYALPADRVSPKALAVAQALAKAGLSGDEATLIIASSYSGNTEEVIDGLNLALEKGLKVAVMASGGKLIEMAKEKELPYIQLPAGMQPRMSSGYQVKALAKLLGREDTLKELNNLTGQLNPSQFESKGKELAEKIGNKIPVIYSSQANYALAYTWKIRFNEAAKIPAFYNVFPEANHNEMSGFDSQGSTVEAKTFASTPQKGRTFIFILLADSEDHPKIQKRMAVFSKLFTEKGFAVEQIDLAGEGRFYRLFANLLLADWTSYYLAKQKGVDPEAIPLVEEFKKLIS